MRALAPEIPEVRLSFSEGTGFQPARYPFSTLILKRVPRRLKPSVLKPCPSSSYGGGTFETAKQAAENGPV